MKVKKNEFFFKQETPMCKKMTLIYENKIKSYIYKGKHKNENKYRL